MKNKETLFTWIKNAYAMEKELETVLDRYENDAEEYPEFQRLIREHKEQTKSQADRLEDILEAHDEGTPDFKAGIGKAMGFLKAESTEFAKDQIIKNWITLHSAEHFEMASYRVIIETSKLLNENEIRTVCTDILHEEEEAIRKLDQVMPIVLATFLEKEKAEDRDEDR
jgi:ferritin-like metal-binding protein YciE